MTITKKLFEIQKKEISVSKDGKNPHFKSNYITLDNLINTLTPICNELGILMSHYTDEERVITQLTDIEDNDQIASSFPIIGVTNAQQVGSAITYAKRYNLCQLFNIITDRDDDGNIASLQDTAKQIFTPATPSTPKTDDLPWIDDNGVKRLLEAYKEGVIVAKTSEELVKVARTRYKVSKKFAEQIEAGFNT